MKIGRYELMARLATGGMGEVFLARRRGPGDIENRVVIKRIRRDLSRDARFVEMFLREARLSMKLNHGNIAGVFDFGRVDEDLFIAMRYIEGRDLARALRKAKEQQLPLSPTAVAHMGFEVCGALDYAHSGPHGQPVVHRDLSPKNLLLSFSGEVVVADFGLAISSADDQQAKGVRGTPAYLSPEQAHGQFIDAQSDLYSLGLVLHEALIGEPAYLGDNITSVLEQAKAGSVGELPDQVPSLLREIVARATARDRATRYQNARDMQHDLDRFVVDQRAQGAVAPRNEISTWLRGLFGDEELESVAPGSDSIVTSYLDQANELAEPRMLSGFTEISIANTVGEESVPTAPARRPPRLRWLLFVVVLAVSFGVFAVAAAIVSRNSSQDSRLALALDASAVGAITSAPAAASVATDAGANPESPMESETDAAADPRFGWVHVQSKPWAEVGVKRHQQTCPETPCKLRLPVGRHILVLTNPVANTSIEKVVQIRHNQIANVLVTLPRP